MDPVILGLGALAVHHLWRCRFTQRGQMAALLREATVDVADDGDGARATQHAKQVESDKNGDRGRGSSLHVTGDTRDAGTAHVLLVVHAVAATALALVAGREDLGYELAVLASLILHIVVHVLYLYTRRLTKKDEGAGRAALGRYLHLNGRYIKDRDASEPMDPCCDIMMIHGIMRYALRFIVGSDVAFKDGEFSFAAFSVIRWFKIVERYKDGLPAKHRRRDLRSGEMLGTATVSPGERPGTPVVTVLNRFGGFREGTLREVFSWPSDDVMEVYSVLENEAGRASFKQVFRKEQ